MIRCVIVDDEMQSLVMLEWLLKTYCPNVQIEAKCNDAQSGIEAVQKHRPDLLFLDIEMPHMNGFDMLEQFDELFFDVVFTTAYDQFAIKAFKYSALNYLLKPVDPEDLKETIRRVEQRRNVPIKEQMELLMQSIRDAGRQTLGRIALTTNDGLLFVNTSEIIYCESDSNYTTVVMTGGQKILVSKTLKDIDEALAGNDFYRIHNSFLVNLSHIKKYVRSDGGYVIMDNGTSIGISRTKKQEFVELFSKF